MILENIRNLIQEATQGIFQTKVDKIEGKGLSTNDFTNSDKSKVNTIDNKVDKITGKGLSTNDFTASYKNQLDGLNTNLSKKVDVNQGSSNSGKYLRVDSNGDVFCSVAPVNEGGNNSFSGDYYDLTNAPEIPNQTSDLINDGEDGNPFFSQSDIGDSNSTDSFKLVACNDLRLSDERNPKVTPIPQATDTTIDEDKIDLNKYIERGFYHYSGTNVSAQYVMNKPGTTNAAFFLMVERWGTQNNNTYVKQTLTYYTDNKTYIRTKRSNTESIYLGWNDWVEITSDTLYSADENTLTKSNNNIFSLKNSSKYIKQSDTDGYIKNDGSIGTPENTTYTAGTGLTLTNNNEFKADIGNSNNVESSKLVACNDSRLSDTRSPKSEVITASDRQNDSKDLNDYVNTGFYYCADNTNAKNVSNTPLAIANNVTFYDNDQGFTLLVETRNNVNQVKQTLTYVNHGTYTPKYDTYVRIKNVNWQPWVKIYTNNNLTLSDINGQIDVVKQSTADSGYAATYILKQGNTNISQKINIPKDFLVKSASLQYCITANTPISGLKVNDPYLDFVVNTKNNDDGEEHIYINVADLVDTYTAGTGLTLENNEFSLSNSDDYVKISDTPGYITNDGSISTPPDTTYTAGNGLILNTSNNQFRADTGNFLNTESSKLVACSDLRLSDKRDPKLNAITASNRDDKYNDLNTYISSGFYYCYSATAARNIKNTPLSELNEVTFYDNDQAFTLLVENRGAGAQVKQTLTYVNNNTYTPKYDTYVRIRNTNWQPWVKVYTSNNLTADEITLTKNNDSFSLKDADNYVKISNTPGYIKNDGSIDTPTDTTYTAGTGLTLNSNTNEFSLSNANDYIKISTTPGYIKNDGSIDTPTDTTYTSGTGLILSNNNEFRADIGNSSNIESSKLVACNDSRLSDRRDPKATLITATGRDEGTFNDLDQYVNNGFYYCANGTNARNIRHTPLTQINNVDFYDNDQAFTLLVENRGNTNQVKQTLSYALHNTYTPKADTYVRVKVGANAWKAWTKIYTNSNLKADETTITQNNGILSLKNSNEYIKTSNENGYIKNDGTIGGVATQNYDGLMSHDDKIKLDTLTPNWTNVTVDSQGNLVSTYTINGITYKQLVNQFGISIISLFGTPAVSSDANNSISIGIINENYRPKSVQYGIDNTITTQDIFCYGILHKKGTVMGRIEYNTIDNNSKWRVMLINNSSSEKPDINGTIIFHY